MFHAFGDVAYLFADQVGGMQVMLVNDQLIEAGAFRGFDGADTDAVEQGWFSVGQLGSGMRFHGPRD